MRRVIAFGLVAAMVAAVPFSALAAGRSAPRLQNQTGVLKGEAKDAKGQKLTNAKVRIRNSSTGEIASEVTTDATGGFTATGLAPATYVVEIVGENGTVIGLSPAITVAAGTTATVSVTATAIGAVTAAGATAGGVGLFGLGTAATVGIIGAAATGAIVGVRAAKKDASPSGQ
jgi:Carboxypeptidase regulatory-like domain